MKYSVLGAQFSVEDNPTLSTEYRAPRTFPPCIIQAVNHYEIWVNLAPGASDIELIRAVRNYLDFFKSQNKLEGYTIRRRKFGFGPPDLGEFYISIAFKDLAQMDQAFFGAASRDEVVEPLHHEVYSRVKDFKSALYRDFPDDVRPI